MGMHKRQVKNYMGSNQSFADHWFILIIRPALVGSLVLALLRMESSYDNNDESLPSAEAAYATVRKEAAHQSILGATNHESQGIAAGLAATKAEGVGLATKGFENNCMESKFLSKILGGCFRGDREQLCGIEECKPVAVEKDNVSDSPEDSIDKVGDSGVDVDIVRLLSVSSSRDSCCSDIFNWFFRLCSHERVVS
nr:ribonuclease H-like domain-containing protein [Tanacetum cinerariifolium]